jgi:hypothetical protein
MPPNFFSSNLPTPTNFSLSNPTQKKAHNPSKKCSRFSFCVTSCRQPVFSIKRKEIASLFYFFLSLRSSLSHSTMKNEKSIKRLLKWRVKTHVSIISLWIFDQIHISLGRVVTRSFFWACGEFDFGWFSTLPFLFRLTSLNSHFERSDSSCFDCTLEKPINFSETRKSLIRNSSGIIHD